MVVLALCATTASGGELRDSVAAGALIFGANYADAYTTHRVVAAGGYEAWNPGLYGLHGERVTPVKLAIAAAETGAFVWLRRKNKALAWAFVGGVVVGNAYLALHNERVRGRLK